MKNIEINLEELNSSQLLEISGGGFFRDLGEATRTAWNSALDSVDSFFYSYPNLRSHSRQGI
jgi:hypothetical protein